MPTVDLVYDAACPNVKAARANLMRAFSRAGIPARWAEHQIGADHAPARVRGFGSPTILVDGSDVAGVGTGSEDCCRLYDHGGAPDVELIAAALERAHAGDSDRASAASASADGLPPKRSLWKSTAAVIPGIGVALLPKVVCPLCWPAYAGILSAAGLTFLMEDRWLLPISAVLLLAALAALAWKARSRRGYGPLALGALSSSAILVARFVWGATPIVYVGVAALVFACIWNAWPRRVASPSCPACRVTEAN